MRYRLFTYAMTTLACIGGLLTTSPAFAEKGQKQAAKKADATKQSARDNDYKPQQLPKALRNLDLTSEQKTKIRKAMLEHQKQFRETWKKFHAAHARAINLEATWYAAVRDTLSEDDQKSFDKQRMNDRKKMSVEKGLTSSEKQKKAETRRKQGTAKRTEKAANRQDTKAKQKQTSQKVTARKPVQSGKQRQKGKSDENVEGFVIITMTSPVVYLDDVRQSASQKHQCSEVCRKYERELSTAWKQIHRLHKELVKIEAQKLEAIENQLTEEQLTQLRKNREKPSKSQETASTSSSNRS